MTSYPLEAKCATGEWKFVPAPADHDMKQQGVWRVTRDGVLHILVWIPASNQERKPE